MYAFISGLIDHGWIISPSKLVTFCLWVTYYGSSTARLVAAPLAKVLVLTKWAMSFLDLVVYLEWLSDYRPSLSWIKPWLLGLLLESIVFL